MTPEGAVPSPKPRRDETLIRALVRAHRWRRRIESGQARSVTDLAEQEGVTDAYVCRLLPLSCLPPHSVETILDGRQPNGRRLAAMLGNGPLTWEEQRYSWGLARAAATCDSIGRFAPALPRARLRAMIGASIVELVGRERCAGGRPLSTISTGTRAQGRDALCSGGCAIFGGRVSRRCRKRRWCHSPPRRRHAPQKSRPQGFQSSLTPAARITAGRLRASHPAAPLQPFICLAPDIVEAILGGWADQRVMLEQLERPLPASWEEPARVLCQASG